MTSRLFGLSLLVAATACASTQSARPTLSPRNGPKASIHVSYDGFLTNREVRPRFQVDRSAHVIVGRLGGEGRIEILYPETPRASDIVEAKKWYTMEAFQTQYDGVPRLFNYAAHSYRSPSARWSSYDGRGNGFVFIIATEQPMFTELLDDHGLWSDELVVEDYYSLSDPRYAIRDFADEITRGQPYSLDYANSFTTTAYPSYADVAYDCNLLSNYGWGFSGFGFGFVPGSFFDPGATFMYRYSRFGFASGFGAYSPACGGYSRPANFYYGFGYGTGWPVTYPPGPSTPTGPSVPTVVPGTPRSSAFNTGARRPGHLEGQDESRSDVNVTRQRFAPDRPSTSSGNSWAPPINAPRSFADPITRTNGSSHGSGSFGSTRTEGVTRSSSPAPSAPRAATHSAPAKPVVQNPGSTQRNP